MDPHVLIDIIRSDLITIGEGTVITQGTVSLSYFLKDDCMYLGEMNIGKRVFIGTNTIIVNGVTIGDGALLVPEVLLPKMYLQPKFGLEILLDLLKKREINIR